MIFIEKCGIINSLISYHREWEFTGEKMSIKKLGEVIKEIREEKDISRSQLCCGLCSETMLRKFEQGERMPELDLANALLSRLGKSPDKLEVIISQYDYEKMEMRNGIIDDIRFHWFQRVVEKMQIYEREYMDSEWDELFLLRMSAFLEYEKADNLEEAERLLNQVIERTIPCKKPDKIKPYSLALFEIENLLVRCDLWIRKGRNEAQDWLDAIASYTEQYQTDAEERIKILPKIAYLKMCTYMEAGEYAHALDVGEKALSDLREEFSLVYVVSLLTLLCEATEKIGEKEKLVYYTLHKNNIEETYQMFSENPRQNDVLYYSPSYQQIFLDSEIVKHEREKRGWSQSLFIEGIYSEETAISRFENGKTKVSNDKLTQMLDKLDIHKGRYNCGLATTNFKMLEIYHEISDLIARRKYDRVDELLDELERNLDMTDTLNWQKIMMRRLSVQIKKGTISKEEALERFREMLEATGVYIDGKVVRAPFSIESSIIIKIATMLSETDRKTESAKLLSTALDAYAQSKIKEKYVFRNVVVMRANLCKTYEEADNIEKSIAAGTTVIKMELQIGDAGTVGRNLTHLAAAMEKKNADALRYYMKSYYLCDFYFLEWETKVLGQYLAEQYQTILD